MKNAQTPATAEGMPSFTRRSIIGHGAVALAGGAAIAFALPDMDARASAHMSARLLADDPDPTLAAIAVYQAAWAAWQESDICEGPEFDELDAAERATWNDVCEIHPTTLVGLSEMAGYVGRVMSRDTMLSQASINMAMTTIASVAARLAYRAERGL